MSDQNRNALRELRRSRHLSQKQVAKELGVTLDDYRKWEHHLADASFCDAVLLSRYFEVPLRALFFCE